jgi:hypothetical protein
MPVKVTVARPRPVCISVNLIPRSRVRHVYKPCVICQTPTKARTVPPPGSKLSPVYLCSWCAHVVTDLDKLPTAEQTALWKAWLDDSLRFRDLVKRKQAQVARNRSLYDL